MSRQPNLSAHTPPTNWPINTYWAQSKERISQHWYISFCLMMSAIQDYLTGISLVEKENLNWATTCFYYSLVHTGRLTAFCVVGDLPKFHKVLRSLYSNNDPVELNWLKGFDSTQEQRLRVIPRNFRMKVSELLEESGDSATDKFKSFCDQIDRFAPLRSDANYESLIIAHEKNHRLVTDAFKRLGYAARLSAVNAASIAILIYKAYVSVSSLLEANRNAFKSISNQYVTGRLYTCLSEKIADCNSAKAELEKHHRDLRFDISKPNSLLSEVKIIENQIWMEQFDSKRSLMRSFRDNIERFERAVPEARRI